jgi:hypothetical protein
MELRRVFRGRTTYYTSQLLCRHGAEHLLHKKDQNHFTHSTNWFWKMSNSFQYYILVFFLHISSTISHPTHARQSHSTPFRSRWSYFHTLCLRPSSVGWVERLASRFGTERIAVCGWRLAASWRAARVLFAILWANSIYSVVDYSLTVLGGTSIGDRVEDLKILMVALQEVHYLSSKSTVMQTPRFHTRLSNQEDENFYTQSLIG